MNVRIRELTFEFLRPGVDPIQANESDWLKVRVSNAAVLVNADYTRAINFAALKKLHEIERDEQWRREHPETRQ
jgi:hypothetical protein